MKAIAFSIVSIAALAAAAPASAASTSCENLAKLRLPHSQVSESKPIAKGAFLPPAAPGRLGGAGATIDPIYASLPAFCKVLVTSRPTADSDITIEVWLPVTAWNGRIEAVGNGALGSNIPYPAMAQALTAGYAAAATNTGHEGGSGEFALGHPEKLVDWGYRAVHELSLTTKAIVAAHYGNSASYAYWNSCSTGGRQGLVSAEYFPKDFDGIVAGDPANPMTRLQASTIYSNRAVTKDAASFISAAKWAAYRKAALNKCDAADGVKDGLLNDPPSCRFDPKEMACKEGSDGEDCLTVPQIDALNTVLAGMKNPRTGEQLHPGWPVGAMPGQIIVGPKPEQVAIDLFRMVFQQPGWDYHTMDFDKDIARSDKLGNSVINAADPSRLKTLFDRGGKILMYHGWTDPNISPLQTIDYYTRAVAANGGSTKADDSIRLFMVPGMNHCAGGDGPNTFDKMQAISDWVEHRKAPDLIISSHVTAGQVDRTRPLCPYPQIAKYKGSGSIDDAANFSCAAR